MKAFLGRLDPASARAPLPVRIARETWRQTQKAELLLVASSLAYTTILSIVPLLAVSFAIFKAFGGMERLYQTVEPFILEHLAEGSSDEVIAQLRHIISNVNGGTVGAAGFIGLIFTSMSMLASIEKALNRVWGARIERGWFQRFATYWLFITLGPLAFALALGLATSSDMPLASVLPGGTGLFFLTVAGFFAIYRYVPTARVSWKSALAAAVCTSIVWNITRLVFGIYTARAVSYSRIYGSLSAIPILLLWLYIIWVVVLTGAALSAALQKRVEHVPVTPDAKVPLVVPSAAVEAGDPIVRVSQLAPLAQTPPKNTRDA